MWFVLGLVSLVVVLAWQIRWRWRRPWVGVHQAVYGSILYRRHLLTYQGNIRAMQVGVAVPEFFRFELKRETWVDRFFKWVGLSVEKQFGHDGFDSLVYVASDDQHLLNRVADSPELRLAAQRLFVEARAGCRVKRVFCAHGWLVAHISRGSLFSSKDDATRLEQNLLAVLPFLDQLAQALRASQRPRVPADRRDPFLLPGVLLLSVSSALAINGLLFLLRPALFDSAFLLDTARMVHLALWVGGGILVVLLAAHFILLARSARAHLYLLELLLVGSFGAFTSAASELREANIEWDAAPATLREATVVDKSIHRGRRGRISHYLHVQDWHAGHGTRRIKVSRSFYDAIDRGRVLVFEERPGRLGAAWARLVAAKPR